MTPESDIFGAALRACYEGESQATLLVHDEGNSVYQLPVSLFFRAADYYQQDLIAMRKCRGRVLDIGAGAGIHAVWLAQNGFDVTALDISPAACEIMRRRGLKVIEGDIFTARLPGDWHSWLLLGRSIGATGSLARFDEFLQLAGKRLAHNGQIILNSTTGDAGRPVIRRLTFEFRQRRSRPIPWLDIDYDTLDAMARKRHFIAEILHADAEGNYLAMLTRREH